MIKRLSTATPAEIDRWGGWVITAALSSAVSLLLLATWFIPIGGLGLAGLVIAGTAVFFLSQRPLLHLSLVLLGFCLTISYTEGLTAVEIIYGLYYLSFLGGWYIYNVGLRRERMVDYVHEKALIAFVGFATTTLALTFIFDGNLLTAFREWLPLTWFAFYFPIKKACEWEDRALKVLLVVFGGLTLFVVVRNLIGYQQMVATAEETWRIMSARIRMNERFLMLGAFGSLCWFLYSRRLSGTLVASGGFLFCLAGIIIGQSRALWVAFTLGLGLIFLFVDRHHRIRLTLVATTGLTLFVSVMIIAFDNRFELVFSGLTDRFVSIMTAFTDDLSLVNRFHEWRAAGESIIRSPILGHGFGVDYSYYSLVYQYTSEKSHIHSTYLALLYRHGVIGFVLLLFFWGWSFLQGIVLLTQYSLNPIHKTAVLSATAAILSLAVTALTESLFTVSGGVFVLMFPAAVLSGLRVRYSHPTDGDE